MTGNLGRFPNDSRTRCGACPRFRIRADYRRVPMASICSYILSRWEEESLYLDIGYPISEKRYRMFRGFGMFRKRGLRPWVLNILRRSPKNGAEIMDEIENMSQGWWRPSPGSVYPMLEEMVQDGLIKKREDGRYELTSKAQQEEEWPFSNHFTGPRSIDAMLNEITGYISYFEDLTKTDRAKLESHKDKIRTIAERLTVLVK